MATVDDDPEGIDYGRFFAPTWFDDPNVRSIWMAAYEMLLVSEDDIRRGAKSFEALGARISFGFGSLGYFDTSNVRVQLSPGQGPVFLDPPEDGRTDPGPYLVVALPTPGGSANPDHEEARRRENAVVALVVALLGKNAAAKRLFDMLYDVNEDAFGMVSVVDNPFRHGKPNLRDQALMEVESASRSLHSLAATARARVELSLRWFGESLAEEVDEDAFIKLWVALEVLAMPNQTDVRPLNEILSEAYGADLDEIKQRFRVGLIQGLRADMLHEGVTGHHFPLINSYTEALYIDVLRHALRLPHVAAAHAILVQEEGAIWARLRELRRRLKDADEQTGHS